MRPLIICDCDEVLLHMVRHFRDWLDEVHDIDFHIGAGDFMKSIRRRPDGTPLEPQQMWGLLDGFFPDEMHRQTPVPHAADAIGALAQVADIVILTNLQDHCRDARAQQLSGHGIVHRVETNQGGKGEPVAALMAEHGDPVTVFIDDLGVHHASVARHAPRAHRLHLVAEPALAAHIQPAADAHARIDDWRQARSWIEDRIAMGHAA